MRKDTIRRVGRPGMLRADDGSALPMFLFGFAFLIATSLVVVSASGSLLQQRRLNGMADTLALAGANYSRQVADASNQPGASDSVLGSKDSVDVFLASLLVSIYPDSRARIAGLAAPIPGEVRLRICQPNNALLARIAANSEVCASSAAKAN